MELKNFFAQDGEGAVIPGATGYLYQPGTTTIATGLKDKDGADLANPMPATAQGLFQFAAPDGDYDFRVVGAGRDVTLRVRFADGAAVAANAFAAQAAADSLNDRLAFIQVPGGEYAVTFAPAGGPIAAGITATGLLWDFGGVRTMPFRATDGTLAGTLTATTTRSGLKFAAYDESTRAILFGVDYNDQFVCNFSIPEIITARGSAADINTRLSRSLTAAGSPKTGVQNLARLRGLRSALTFLKLGGAALVHVILDGDSWFDSKGYGTTDAITRFYSESGLANAGPGWIGFASPLTGAGAHGTALNNISVTRDANWTNLFLTDGATPAAQNFPGYDACQATAANATITLVGSTVANCASLTLFCSKGGAVEQSWDGTNWTSVTVAAGSGSTTATINMTGKTNTLRMRCASGTRLAGLFGLTAASGVVFSNLSNSGSTAAQKAAVQANADYLAMMAALPGDAVAAVIQMGLNDTKAGAENTIIVSSVGSVAAGYRTAYKGFPSCDVLVACQPNTPLSVQDTLAPLLRAWAEDNDAAFLDWQGYFGATTASGDYSTYSRDYTSGAASTATPLLEVSTAYRHPSPTSALTAAGKSAVLSGAGVVAGTLSNVFLSPLRSN